MSETIERAAPVEVFPLAEFLCDEMEARGWTDEDVAIRMGGLWSATELAHNLLSFDLLLCVHSDGLSVGDAMFAKIAKAFGVDETYLRNLDAAWRAHPSKRSPFTPPDKLFGPTMRNSSLTISPSP